MLRNLKPYRPYMPADNKEGIDLIFVTFYYYTVSNVGFSYIVRANVGTTGSFFLLGNLLHKN